MLCFDELQRNLQIPAMLYCCSRYYDGGEEEDCTVREMIYSNRHEAGQQRTLTIDCHGYIVTGVQRKVDPCSIDELHFVS